jgi:hypothetical protein
MNRDALRDFIAHHDDRWLFVVVYITLAVVLSIVLSLFWLVAVGALHFVLEYLRQTELRRDRADVLSHAMWEVKLDVALILLALALALYMDVILGVLGLQSAARAAAATRITRFAAWERNLRAIVLLADDVARVIQIGYTRLLRRPAATIVLASVDGGEAAVTAAGGGVSGPRSFRDPWTPGDRFTVALLGACILLILAAPVVTEHSWGGATVALLEQLHPFPAR